MCGYVLQTEHIPWICIRHCILKTVIEMVLSWWRASRVWHAELAFFVIAVSMVNRTLTADAKEQQHSQGLKICFVVSRIGKSFTFELYPTVHRRLGLLTAAEYCLIKNKLIYSRQSLSVS